MAATTQELQRAAEHTIQTLVTNFGFPRPRCVEAVNAVGDPGDVEAAVAWLLDHGEEDKGGAVSLKRCPHAANASLANPRSLQIAGASCADGCGRGENWLCLHCGEVRCSRYVKSHNLRHYEQTLGATTIADAAEERTRGHCLAASLGDLSIWCYECNAYVEHDALVVYSRVLAALKHGERPEPGERERAQQAGADVQVGSPMAEPHAVMHGLLGDPSWEAPKITKVCHALARPGYKTLEAHEYRDTPKVLDAKVELLAKMLLNAKHACAYTGAGISTASGIRDYATKGSSQPAFVHPLRAQPTVAHRALAALHHNNLLAGGYVQQNHDGLPQKAGFPQSAINEIHGAWFDPSNPVVPMDGTLRGDLMTKLMQLEDTADVCLVMGTSLCGMNSDRIAISTARRAAKKATGNALSGSVLVNLQRTALDERMQLRIYAKCDVTMTLLLSKLGFQQPEMPRCPLPRGQTVFPNLPYDPKTGLRSQTKTLTLDLTPGKAIRLVQQPEWDAKRCGASGVVQSVEEDGHVIVALAAGGDRRLRTLGWWWIAEAVRGEVAYLPVIN